MVNFLETFDTIKEIYIYWSTNVFKNDIFIMDRETILRGQYISLNSANCCSFSFFVNFFGRLERGLIAMYRSKPTRNQIRQGTNVIIFGTLVSYFVSLLNMSTRPVRNIQNISEECSDGRNSKFEREQIEGEVFILHIQMKIYD